MKKIFATLAMSFVCMGLFVATASAEQHEVKDGDSLWKISEKYETEIQDLIDINNLDSTVIHPGDVIHTNSIYIVKKGDTLDSIASEFDITVKEIIKWNKLTSNTITVDQELDLNGATASKSNETSKANESVKKSKNSGKAKKAETKTKKKETTAVEKSSANKAPEGKKLSVSATAYTAKCDGCSGVTATGVDLNSNPNAKVIAVDPSIIPLGSKVHVEGYGEAIAADTGGAIKGNKIDIHVPTKGEALQWGRRTVEITVLN